MAKILGLGVLTCLGICFGGPAPQSLDINAMKTIKEIFGDGDAARSGGGYSGGFDYGEESYNFDEENDGAIDVLLQMVKDDVNKLPSDYVEPENSGLVDQPTVITDVAHENCADYTEEFGYECVPYYQCQNGSIITDGAGLIDIRNGFGSLSPEDSKCPGFLDVCCKDPDFVPPPKPKEVFRPKCGRRNVNGLGVRIQGFKEAEAQFGEWPHMCAVLHKKSLEPTPGYTGEVPQTVNLYQCGGSLIAPGVIMTAAHCVDKFRDVAGELIVRCGEWDTQNETEPYPHQDRLIKDLSIHPEFNGRNLQNDFALLYTEEDFELSNHIDTVCLPTPEELFEGDTCFATGWGKDKFGSAGNYQVVLKEIDLSVVNHDQCENSLRRTRLGKRYRLHDSFICAGGESGKDTCKGDGGSPLVCPSKYDPNTYVQAGIVAWGIGCGEDGTPGVYASVSKAICWIDYAMSCYYGATTGDFSSYWGYSRETCGAWMDNTIAELAAKRDSTSKRFAPIFTAQIEQYQQCNVHWLESLAEPTNDISDLSRLEENNGYGKPVPVKQQQSGNY